jgi:hypothetical protein
MRTPIANANRVGIWRRADHADDTNHAAGTGRVFDYDGLAERCAHPLGHDPRNRI